MKFIKAMIKTVLVGMVILGIIGVLGDYDEVDVGNHNLIPVKDGKIVTSTDSTNNGYNRAILGVDAATIGNGYTTFTKIHNNDNSTLSVCDAGTWDMVTGNVQDSNIFAVGFEYYNNAKTTINWSMPWSIKAFQDGIQLQEEYSINVELSERTTLVKSGSKISFLEGFKLRSLNSPVLIEVKANLAFSKDNIMQVEYDLSKIKQYYQLNYSNINNSIQNKEQVETVNTSISNEKEALEYLKEYLNMIGAYEPECIDFDGMVEQGYNFHGYDDMGDHVATSFWYAVSPDGRIYDGIACQYIDEPEYGELDTNESEYNDSSEYILPDSNTRYYTMDEIIQLPIDGLRLARNEIFARHGYSFKDEELKNYFSQWSWYEPTDISSEEIENILNNYEKQNLQLIREIESQI